MPYPKIIRNRYRVGETDNRQHFSTHHEEDMHDFHLPLARLHQRHLHTWGICAGLEVSSAADASTVTVQPGVAIDAEGRMIVLADNGKAQIQEGSLTNVPVVLALSGLTGQYYVTLAYAENEQPEPGDTTGRTRPVNVQQAPLVRLEAVEGFVDNGRALILAVLTITVDGEQRLAGLQERLGETPQRRLVGQTVAEVAFQRPVTVANQVSATLSGQLRALPAGGLQLTVANPTDPIELQGADGNHFAELRIRAHSTQMQGSLTVQGELQVTGLTRLPGALAVDTIMADDFRLHSATGGRPLLRIIAGTQPQDNTIHLLPGGGNVGIGTTQPGYTLDVNGSLNMRELYVNGAPFSTLLPAPSPWTTLATGIAFNGGQVGIGTTIPEAKVQIEAGSLFINGEGTGVIVDESGRKRVGFMKYSGREAGIWRLSNQKFEIGRLNDGVTALPGAPTAFTTDLFVGDNGNVGIQTMNPRNPLAIRGQGVAEELLSFEDSSGNTKWHINQKLAGVNSGLNFAETGVADGRFFIGAGGNVGIGTTTPGFRLDVVERIRVRQGGSGSAGIWFHQAGPNNDRAFVGMADDNNVGFWGNTGVGWGLLMDTGNGDVTIRGRLGTLGWPAAPRTPGWGGGIHTWDVEAEGTMWSRGGYASGNRDLAENFAATTALEPGDVVALDPLEDRVTLAGKANDPHVLGVVSTAPGVLLNENHDQAAGTLFPIALSGRVPCKVVTENGSIQRGDLLTASSTPGHAMKAEPIKVDGHTIYRPGTILGKALAAHPSGAGVIDIFVTTC